MSMRCPGLWSGEGRGLPAIACVTLRSREQMMTPVRYIQWLHVQISSRQYRTVSGQQLREFARVCFRGSCLDGRMCSTLFASKPRRSWRFPHATCPPIPHTQPRLTRLAGTVRILCLPNKLMLFQLGGVLSRVYMGLCPRW